MVIYRGLTLHRTFQKLNVKKNVATAFALLGCVAMASKSDDGFPGLETLMPQQTFQAAGLEQLSSKELEVLNEWLVGYTAGAGQLLQNNEAVRRAQQTFEIRSRLTDPFDGWSGNTLFYLENGQRWRQRLSGRYVHRGGPNPEVIITRNVFGFYKLTLVEEGRGVGVSLDQ